MKERFVKMLGNSRSLADIFEVVKQVVWETVGLNRGGLMLGLANLGNHPKGFFGAFHPLGTDQDRGSVVPDAPI